MHLLQFPNKHPQNPALTKGTKKPASITRTSMNCHQFHNQVHGYHGCQALSTNLSQTQQKQASFSGIWFTFLLSCLSYQSWIWVPILLFYTKPGWSCGFDFLINYICPRIFINWIPKITWAIYTSILPNDPETISLQELVRLSWFHICDVSADDYKLTYTSMLVYRSL